MFTATGIITGRSVLPDRYIHLFMDWWSKQRKGIIEESTAWLAEAWSLSFSSCITLSVYFLLSLRLTVPAKLSTLLPWSRSAGLLLLWSSCIFPFCRWGFLAWISCFHFYVLDSVCLSTTKKIAFYLLILDLWKDNLHSSRKVIKWREIFGYLFSLNFSSLSLSTLLKCFFNKNKLLLLEDNYKNSSIV